MGYWQPPPPSAFNPVPRPFSWHAEGDGPYPEPEDEAFYGVGRSASLVEPVWSAAIDPRTGNPVGWIAPPGCPMNFGDQDRGSGGPWPNYGDLVCVGGYGAGFSYKNKTPLDRLAYYRKMIALRTPTISWQPSSGDPEGGGLAADVANDQGIFINYFDCSDSDNPRRKFVFYPADGSKDGMHVRQWNVENQEWEDEGFDYDRDLPKIFQAAFAVIGTVGAVALSFVTVDPAILGAFGGMMNQLSQAARPGGKIDPFGMMQQVFSVTKAIPDFAETMTNVVLKNSVLASIYDSGRKIVDYAKNFEHQTETFFSSFGQAVTGNFSMIPKIAPDALAPILQGVVPPELAAVAPVDALLHSVDAYLLQGEHAFLARRKFAPFTGGDIVPIVDWRSAFDMMYASLVATQTIAIQDPRWLADQGSDPQATMTVAQVLAHGKQSAAQAQGVVSFWQIAKTLPASPIPKNAPPPAPAIVGSPASAGAKAAGVAFAVVLAKLLFF